MQSLFFKTLGHDGVELICKCLHDDGCLKPIINANIKLLKDSEEIWEVCKQDFILEEVIQTGKYNRCQKFPDLDRCKQVAREEAEIRRAREMAARDDTAETKADQASLESP